MKFINWYIGMWKKPKRDWTEIDGADMMFVSVLLTIPFAAIVCFIAIVINYFTK